MKNIQIEVRRDDIQKMRVVESDLPELQDGAVRLVIDKFGLSSNNVSYAVSGVQLKYWDFFQPSGEGWGRVPMWGFVTVAESRHPEIAKGGRLYGYLPMGTHLDVLPGNINPFQFLDTSPHRPTHAPLYNEYARIAKNPMFQPGNEEAHMILYPLFGTSFLLDDFISENEGFGARTIVLGSGSSKTAIGLAWLLSQREGYRVIGLTSASNREFVESLGYYSQVASYDDLKSLKHEPAMFIDMAGNPKVTASVHEHYQDELKHSAAVGATHWEAARDDGDRSASRSSLPGARPRFFFAPNQAARCIGRWGPQGLFARLGKSANTFFSDSDKWMKVEHCQGVQGAQKAWAELTSNKARPETGYAVVLKP